VRVLFDEVKSTIGHKVKRLSPLLHNLGMVLSQLTINECIENGISCRVEADKQMSREKDCADAECRPMHLKQDVIILQYKPSNVFVSLQPISRTAT